MPTITFQFAGGDEVKVSAALGRKLLDVAQDAGIAIDAPCGGVGV